MANDREGWDMPGKCRGQVEWSGWPVQCVQGLLGLGYQKDVSTDF